MTLYQIVKSLQATSSTKEKTAILTEHKENSLLKAYIEATLSPRYNYYVTEKTLPKPTAEGTCELKINTIDDAIETIAKRKLTGHAALDGIQSVLNRLTKEGQELLTYLFLKDMKCNVGETIAGKVWPEFQEWTPKYMRCSLPKDVDLASWPWERGVYSQTKYDGMYAELSREEALTRNGSRIDYSLLPIKFQHAVRALPEGILLNGEFIVLKDDVIQPRKVGNGLLNKVIQGNPLPPGYEVAYHAWDYTSDGTVDYTYRLGQVAEIVKSSNYIYLVDSTLVYSYQEAVADFREKLSQGEEGTILKHPDGKWKDGTSKQLVKMKLEVECDLIATAFHEGTGKAKGMLGAVSFSSSCGNVKTDVGSGYTDAQRVEIWNNKEKYAGKIAAIKANDLITREGSDKYSLFLPIMVEWRHDKTQADDFNRIQSAFDSAKGLK